MSKVPPSWTRAPREIAPYLTDLRAMLTNGLTFGDNHQATFAAFSLVHGVQSTFDHPRNWRARGFIPMEVRDEDGAIVHLAGDIGFDPRAEAGKFGLTARFAPPNGAIVVTRSSNFPVPTGGTATSMEWSGIDQQVGDAIEWDSANDSQVVLNEDGIVEVVADGVLFNTAVAGYRESYWLKNGSTSRYYGYDLTPGGTFAATSGYGRVEVSAGDYLELKLFQNSGAALNVLVTAGVLPQGIVRYVDRAPGFAATVTGILVGG